MRMTLEVKENKDGEAYIELPPEILEVVGLKEGDTIKWIDNNDGSWSIVKDLKND